jgi:hypothetical protein
LKVCNRLAAICLVWACVCLAEDAVTPPACADGVCVVNVVSAALKVSPCSDDSVLVAYSQSSGATLIQCSDPSDPGDNKAFVFDRHEATSESYEFRGGRFVRPDYLATAVTEGIPDKMGAVPLCAVKDRRAAAAGELLLADKQPNDSQAAPYCYRIHYVVAGKGTLRIVGGDGRELPAIAPTEIEAWAKLREVLSPYLPKGSTSAALPTRAQLGLVSSDKARLFQAPSLESAGKMYLVKGDQVEIIDDTKFDAGWCKIRYVGKSGRPIVAWMQSSDLSRSQK